MMGTRKIQMMHHSYITLGVLGLAYMMVCAYAGNSPDATVMLSVFGAVGAGHSTANWANAQEHKKATD